MDNKEKYEIGSNVTAKRTYNGETITGEFGGFHLLDKSNPKSIVGVVHTPNGSYDVKPNSIESVISEDERIRKEIIDYLKGFIPHHDDDLVAKSKVWIAWLETQGERKPTDKVEPKFKVGDWIISDTVAKDYRIVKINEIKDGNYYITSIYGYQGFNSFNVFEKDYHLWTIKDAKKGDILQANKCTLIFDSLTKDMDGNTVISSWYYCDTETFYGMGTCKPDLWVIEGIVPATKEQSNLLFQKMEEAGLWDSEKKELKKIEQKMINEHNEHEPTSYEVEKWNEAYEKGYEIGYMNGKTEQKPAEWSKQQVVNALTKWLTEEIASIRKKSLDGTLTERYEMFEAALLEMRSFVNSSDFQIGKDTSAEWSKEDEKHLFGCIAYFSGITESSPYYKDFLWLKSIK